MIYSLQIFLKGGGIARLSFLDQLEAIECKRISDRPSNFYITQVLR